MTLNGQNLGQIEDDLNAETWGMKRAIASKLKLRYTPDINFRMDESFAEVDRIEKLLRDPKVAKDLERKDD
jgi:ribosome-binding factor A